MRSFGPWFRIGMGLLVLISIAVLYAHSRTGPAFNPVNFFSYFTILSNLVGALLFVYSGLRGDVASRTVDMLRGAATVYLATTGIVYNLLLRDEPVGVGLEWVNAVLHAIMPLAAVVDWLVFAPKHELRLNRTWLWLLFPIGYLVYSLIRGAATGWYPYPFLNPDRVGGYWGVAAYAVAISLAFVGLVWGTTWLGNRQRRTKA